MPALDFSLRHRMIRRTTRMSHVLPLEPFGQVAGDELDPLSDSRRGRGITVAGSDPEACRASFNVSVTSSAFIVVQSFQAMM